MAKEFEVSLYSRFYFTNESDAKKLYDLFVACRKSLCDKDNIILDDVHFCCKTKDFIHEVNICNKNVVEPDNI